MFKHLAKLFKNPNQQPPIIYRVCDIIENELGHYQVVVQIVGKSSVFKLKPEDVLADDRLTASFHQHDIRLLTYLGYCGINTPQYMIMAKKILKNEEVRFAVFDKDSQTMKETGADFEINHDTIKKMSAKDAYEIGFMQGRKSTQVK